VACEIVSSDYALSYKVSLIPFYGYPIVKPSPPLSFRPGA
jgi:hypothetical protein